MTRRAAALAISLTVGLLSTQPAGCVKRVWDAPGLPPGSAYAVGSDMRVETFEIDDWEVRAFRIPVTEANNRRYQFVVLKNGIHHHDYTLDRLEDGTWELIEVRADGISIARNSYRTEPSYAALKAEVVKLLRGGR